MIGIFHFSASADFGFMRGMIQKREPKISYPHYPHQRYPLNVDPKPLENQGVLGAHTSYQHRYPQLENGKRDTPEVAFFCQMRKITHYDYIIFPGKKKGRKERKRRKWDEGLPRRKNIPFCLTRFSIGAIL
ncbi:MAG: hypothetical protein IKW00_04620 [Clostridia bacterium]|nr:hypothetical protein [Clostridia bacterium]